MCGGFPSRRFLSCGMLSLSMTASRTLTASGLDATIDPVAEPSHPSVSPRLVSEAQAAAHIGLELRPSEPGSPMAVCRAHCHRKYDMKAIHLALDRLSCIAPRE